MALTAITDSGTQTNTQSPQAATSGETGGTPSNSVQSGTANDLLRSQAGVGIPLNNGLLTTVNLNATATRTQAVVMPPQRHVNPALFGVSILLCIIAVVLFWLTSRAEKTTTK